MFRRIDRTDFQASRNKATLGSAKRIFISLTQVHDGIAIVGFVPIVELENVGVVETGTYFDLPSK